MNAKYLQSMVIRMLTNIQTSLMSRVAPITGHITKLAHTSGVMLPANFAAIRLRDTLEPFHWPISLFLRRTHKNYEYNYYGYNNNPQCFHLTHIKIVF